MNWRYVRRQAERVWIEIRSSILGALGARDAQMRMENGARHAILRVPMSYRLSYVQKHSLLYDYWLPRLVSMAGNADAPDAVVVDVGANVGDSVLAARLCGCVNPIVAIEAMPAFARYLRVNLASNPGYGEKVQVVEAMLVGSNTGVRVVGHRKGTAKTVFADPGIEKDAGAVESDSVPRITLADLDVERCAFLKTDTDGYDPYILEGHMGWIAARSPVVWAEAEVTDDGAVECWARVLSGMRNAGYQHFVLFDNEGALFLAGDLSPSAVEQIVMAISYTLGESRRFENGQRLKKPVHYFDIAIFHGRHGDLYGAFREQIAREV